MPSALGCRANRGSNVAFALEAVEIRRPSDKSWRDAFWEFVVARDASGVPLDIAWMHSALDFPRAFTHQILAPLDRYVQTDDSDLIESFAPSALQLVRYQRQLMGVHCPCCRPW